MATHISHSPAETEALGEAWGRNAESGLVIGLCGGLGAGKTQLVKGLARGLGMPGRVHSPTFALVNVYSGGRLALFHLDWYRLDDRRQIVAAGLEEYLAPAGVAVIEWADKWFATPANAARPDEFRVPRPALPSFAPRFRWAEIEVLGETERRISHEDFGA
jgi:tRNA threonylcarbamoyladenosine biosynthesis protein TsaE